MTDIKISNIPSVRDTQKTGPNSAKESAGSKDFERDFQNVLKNMDEVKSTASALQTKDARATSIEDSMQMNDEAFRKMMKAQQDLFTLTKNIQNSKLQD